MNTVSALPMSTVSALPVNTGSALPMSTVSALPVNTVSALPMSTLSALPMNTLSASTSATNSRCFLCGDPASSCCEWCGLVYYCSHYHLSKHRPKTSDRCLPFAIVASPDKGRYVVATRDIEPLELLIDDTAAAIGPK